MNRAQRRAMGIPKNVASSIEDAEKQRTVNQFSIAVASVLWDMNKDKEEIKTILSKIWDRFDSFKRNYATVEDFRMVLRDEANIDFTYYGFGGRHL